MAIATLLTGCLPTYKIAGAGAIVLLCIARFVGDGNLRMEDTAAVAASRRSHNSPIDVFVDRLLQGLSCGGELVGSIVFLVEAAPVSLGHLHTTHL